MGLISKIGASLIFIGLIAAAVPVAAQDKRKVTIATSSASIPAGAARIAKEMGLFEKHGIEATATPMDNGSVASAALLSGSVDFVTTGPSDVIVAQSRGQKVVAFTSGYRGFAATVVISKAAVEKSGIAADASVAARLKALDGLRIASPSATSTFTVAVKASAEAVGAKVQFVYMAQPAMVAALRTGQIDGFTVSAPYYVQPVEMGLGAVWINGPKGDFPRVSSPSHSVVVITRQDFAQANGDLIRRMSAVFAEFAKAIDDRPADVKSAMAKLWPELDAKTIDSAFAIEAFGFKSSGAVTVEDMAHEIAFMKLAGANLPQIDQLDAKALLFP